MRVRKPSLQLGKSEARLTATVESETAAFAPFELFFAVPWSLAGWLDVSGNPFVPSLLLLAGVLKERLLLEAPVSPLLLRQAPCANGLYSSWWGIAPVKLEAEAAPADRYPAGDGAALFFTRGVDSWYSALRARDGVLPERITHLLYVPDFDRQYSPTSRARALKLTREAAAWLGYPLVALSTNARALLDPFINWERSHGGVLASLGLALGEWLKALVVASSNSGPDDPEPWGSTPQLDPYWSSDQTRVRVDGGKAGRTEKVSALVVWPEVVSRLKVCWQADTDTNCGRCEKCIRTQCALAIAGVADAPGVFEQPLTPEAIARVPRVPRRFWVDLARNPPAPHLAALRDAVRDRLSSPPDGDAADVRGAERPRSTLFVAPSECCLALLPEAIREKLPGPVVVEGRDALDGEGRRLELTWSEPSPGQAALPPRPTVALGEAILNACRTQGHRPVPWCVIDVASETSAWLTVRLTEAWGAGIAFLNSRACRDGDHGLSAEEAAAVQQQCRVRAWWGGKKQLDPFRVLTALLHGCLPLQWVPEEDHDELTARLPRGLEAFTAAFPKTGPVPSLTADDEMERLDHGLSVVLAGSLERDLAHVLAEG